MRDDILKNDFASSLNEDSTELTFDPNKLDDSSSDKLTDWEYEPTIEDLKADLEYARQDNENQKTNINGWLDLRNTTGAEGTAKLKRPGRSTIQPKLIRKHNEWRYPALSEPFLNSDRMFEVKPRTFEDTFAAKQNQTVINYQFDTQLDKVDFIDRYVRTDVDEGTVIVRVGWDHKTEKVLVTKPVYDYYEATDEQQLQMLAEATKAFNDDPVAYENFPEDLKASVEYGLENQIAVIAKENGTEEVYENKVTMNQPSVNIINTKNLFIDPSCEGKWQEAQFMIYTYESTRADLKKRKIFKNLNRINWESNAIKTKVGDRDHESNSPEIDSRINKEKQMILVHEYWGLSDIHKTGETVPVLISFIGDTIIQMEENPFPDRKPPFVIVPYMPVLNSCHGEADASLLQDSQRITGAVTRGIIDLLGRSANAQIGYAKGFLDPVNKRRFTAGEDFEYNPNKDPKEGVQQMTYGEIPNSAFQVLAQQNQEAEGLSGVKSFSAGITGESFGKVAKGIAGAMDAAGMREMSILRRLAEGMRLIAIKIIAMNGKFLSEKEIIPITNEEFVEVSRKDLEGKFDLKTDISTAKVDEERSQDLGYMLQTMGPDMDAGLSKIILAQIADLKRMPQLAQEIRVYEPKPDPLQEELKKLELRKLEADIMLDEAKAIEAKARAEKIRVETDLETSGVKHARSVESQGAQASGNRKLEVTKEILKGETAPGNIEAAVGYNKLAEDGDDAPVIPPQILPNQELGPLQSTQVL